jgi:hypothetical protein
MSAPKEIFPLDVEKIVIDTDNSNNLIIATPFHGKPFVYKGGGASAGVNT